MVPDPGISLVLLFFLATSAMEHGDSSRDSCVGTLGEGDGAPSRSRRLNPGVASSSGYGHTQNAVA
jgi:hypothetical protein